MNNLTENVTGDSIKIKRGRRKPVITIPEIESMPSPIENIQYIISEPVDSVKIIDSVKTVDTDEIIIKKRGRKPKGGKIITKLVNIPPKPAQIANIILHLKCSLSDLNDYNTHINQQLTDPNVYNPSIPPSIMTYNNDKSNTFSPYETSNVTESNNNSSFSSSINTCINSVPSSVLSNTSNPIFAYSESNLAKPSIGDTICSLCNTKYNETDDIDETDEVNIKDVNQKLKKLKINLYKNALPDKKSACFWCTYEYDNPACYIPKYNTDDSIFGYGSFCRPECAVAFLMKENIDDSTKFERYHLLNQIYSKIYNYKKNIKPAPNPYYLLEKFYGNLNIQEYRKLLKSEHMLLVIDKPLTRILPELHEDNEEFILNIYGNNKNPSANTTGIYKVKKQSEKQQGPSKNSIMRNKFNLSQ